MACSLLGFPDSSVGKESACNAGDPGSIPESGKSAGEGIGYPLQYSWASLVAQLVKNLPAIQETWVRSLGWEDPLEKGRLSTPVFWPGEFQGLYIVHGVAKSWTRLSDSHVHILIFRFCPMYLTTILFIVLYENNLIYKHDFK